MSDAAENLAKAVVDENAETALKLLEDAGGACQARRLAKQAKLFDLPGSTFGIDFSLSLDGNKETLTMYKETYYSAGNSEPVAGITQVRCEK